MAQINDIIDELNTIATAFTSVNSFIFDEIGAINEDRSKTYPAILVDSRNIDINPVNFTRSNLPSKVNYKLKLFFLDTYQVSEQKTTTKQTKYAALETIANQYLAEVKRRCEAYSTLKFTLLTRQVNNGFIVDKVHNDDLVQLVYDVTFEAWGECLQGTFADVDPPPSEDVTITVNSISYTTAAPFTSVDIPVKNTANTALGSNIADVWTIPDITVTDSDGSSSTQAAGTNVTCTPSESDIQLRYEFASGDDEIISTITSFSAGTYTSISDDGSSGTITIDINGGGFGAFVNPTTFVNTDVVTIKRTITTGAGYVILTGTY